MSHSGVQFLLSKGTAGSPSEADVLYLFLYKQFAGPNGLVQPPQLKRFLQLCTTTRTFTNQVCAYFL